MAMVPEISVVATFYNNEKDASLCIRSLLDQTFSDSEIILVDDGSTDGTPEILDCLGEEDDRIIVLHKPNGGVSDARNCGVSQASGKYITFVDGDDIISPLHLSMLYGAMKKSSTDTMVIGGIRTIAERDLADGISWEQPDGEWEPIDQEEAARRVLLKRIATTAYGKLAARTFYEAHPFDAAVRYDEALIPPIILNIQEFRLVPAKTYGYIMHPDSMVRGSFSEADALEYADAIKLGKATLLEQYPELETQAGYWDAIYAARFHARAKTMGSPSSAVRALDAQMRREAGNRIGTVMKSRDIGLSGRIRVLLYVKCPRIHDAAMSVYNRIRKGLA